MTDKPLISVVMSVYSEPIEWIKKSIDSVLNQTYSNFEFIIIIDKPERQELINFLFEEEKKDHRIRVFENDKNIGLAASLNKGINLSKGKFIARMDADDISLPYRFERQLKLLRQNNKVGICGGRAKIINEYEKVKGYIKMKSSPAILRENIFFESPFIHPTVMIRRELLDKENYDENLRVAQDWNLWLRLVNETDYANLKDCVLLYRVHDNQSQKKAGIEKTRECKKYADSIFAKNMNLPDREANLFIKHRGGENLSLELLDELYCFLLKKYSSKNQREVLVNRYLHTVKSELKGSIFSSRVICGYPFLCMRVMITEVVRKYMKI